MVARSAGILPFARDDAGLWVFIVHMGGPFWWRKDTASWSLAKGVYDPDTETPEDAARREFSEEVGVAVPEGPLIDLGEVRLSSGKHVRGYAVEAPRDLAFVGSNTNLVAPVKVGRGSYIATGSTVTKAVPEGALAVARARQENKEGWVERKKAQVKAEKESQGGR